MGTFLVEREDSFAVVVVGGGLAGVCAAIASARSGARTALVHDRPVLGGNASSEIRVPPAGAGYHTPFAMETGIVYELVLADRARNHDAVGTGLANSLWDLTLYEAVRDEPNLTLFLNTHVAETEVREGRLTAVRGTQLGSETRWRIAGGMFVDASGDGVVGAAAGCRYRVGQEARSEYGESFAPEEAWTHTLGSSLHFRARDVGRPVDFAPPVWAERFPECMPHRPHAYFEGGYWWIELGWPQDTVRDNEALRDELLAHVLGVWDHIKNRCPHTRETARNWVLDWIGMLPGRRESRRFVGAHVLTQNDLQDGGAFPDTVGFGGWEIDDHTREGMRDLAKKPSFEGVNHWLYFVRPYGVPLRSLHAAEVPNLLFAGRCLSASRLAFNSLRVMLTLGALGQAAGTAAALCAAAGVGPAGLAAEQIRALQRQLLREDVFLPGIVNDDPADWARAATATATSEAPFGGAPDRDGLGMPEPLAQLIPVGPGGLATARIYLASRAAAPRMVRASLLRAEEVWDLSALERGEPLAECAIEVPGGAEDWFDLPWNLADLSAGLHWLRLEAVPEVVWRYTTEMTPGCPAARFANGRWWFAPGPFARWRTFAVRLDPDPGAYGPAQILTGVARPGATSNLWRSNPAAGLPAALALDLGEEREIASVQVTFDTDLSRINRLMPAFFRAPECARDYEIQIREGGEWRTVHAEKDNAQRHRVHAFAPVRARHLRLTVSATNGVPEARVYAIRVYGMDFDRPNPVGRTDP